MRLLCIMFNFLAANAAGDVSRVVVADVTASSTMGSDLPTVDATLARYLQTADRWRLIRFENFPSPPAGPAAVRNRAGAVIGDVRMTNSTQRMKLPAGSFIKVQLFDDVEIELEYLERRVARRDGEAYRLRIISGRVNLPADLYASSTMVVGSDFMEIEDAVHNNLRYKLIPLRTDGLSYVPHRQNTAVGSEATYAS